MHWQRLLWWWMNIKWRTRTKRTLQSKKTKQKNNGLLRCLLVKRFDDYFMRKKNVCVKTPKTVQKGWSLWLSIWRRKSRSIILLWLRCDLNRRSLATCDSTIEKSRRQKTQTPWFNCWFDWRKKNEWKNAFDSNRYFEKITTDWTDIQTISHRICIIFFCLFVCLFVPHLKNAQFWCAEEERIALFLLAKENDGIEKKKKKSTTSRRVRNEQWTIWLSRY